MLDSVFPKESHLDLCLSVKSMYSNTAMLEVLPVGLHHAKLGGQQRLEFSPLPLVPDTPEHPDFRFPPLPCFQVPILPSSEYFHGHYSKGC